MGKKRLAAVMVILLTAGWSRANLLISDDFSGSILGTQWQAVAGGTHSTVTLFNGVVVTKAFLDDGDWIYTSFQSASGYTLPAGNFSVQIDAEKIYSDGWWQEAWMGLIIGSNRYQIQRQWQDGSTAPVWVVGYSNTVNLNANHMQYKFERIGTTLTCSARPVGVDWTVIYTAAGVSMDAATISMGCHNNTGNSISVSWDNFLVTSSSTPILTVSSQNLAMTYESGSTTVSVSNTGESSLDWTATSDSDWLSVSPASGTDDGIITLTCTANLTGASRTGTVTLAGAGQTKVVTVVQAGWWSFDEDFDSQVLDCLSWTAVGSSGYTGFLSLANGKLVYDSNRSDNSYGYLTMSPVNRMDGDFLVDFDFSILQMDYWNSLYLQVHALDNSWAARLTRQQDDWGDQKVVSYLTNNGMEVLQTSVSETANEGILRLKRTGTSLTFWWQPKNGTWQQIGSSITVGDSAVGASICFTSAQATRSRVQLNSYHQEWSKKVPAQLTPVYSSTKVLARAADSL